MGNKDTLQSVPASKGIDVPAMLRSNYQKFYSANNMKLVILGAVPLTLLEDWAYEFFGEIKDKNLPPLYNPLNWVPGA